MRYLLNAIYLLLLLVYLPIIAYQRLANGKKRPGIWTKFVGRGPDGIRDRKRILFHAVSLGEVNAIQTVVKEFASRHPEWEIFVSTTTQTGMDAARRHFPELNVCLLPFDFTWSVNRFLNQLDPNILVLAELEIWPNLLSECRRRSIATCLINGRLNQRSLARYQKLSFVFETSFRQLDLVCCQNEIYAPRFESLGVSPDRILVTGNLKYDALLENRSHPQIVQLAEMVQIQPGDQVWIAGSTQAPEEQIVLDAFENLQLRHPQLRLLICPRHPERFDEVAGLLEDHKIQFSRRSQLASREDGEPTPERVVLLDCMGELGHWWGVGDIAFVGGSFGNRGGQNMIEPLALGAAVCFGPNTRNFAQEVDALNQYDAAVQLNQPEELIQFLERCLSDDDYRTRLKRNGREYLDAHKCSGRLAWQLSLDRIDQLIGDAGKKCLTKAA